MRPRLMPLPFARRSFPQVQAFLIIGYGLDELCFVCRTPGKIPLMAQYVGQMVEWFGLLQAVVAAQSPLHRNGPTCESLRFIHVASKERRPAKLAQRFSHCQIFLAEM